MNHENIPYAAKVNAAYYLVRKARKIARRLADTTSEQQQAIENEIAVIGMRMYSEACEQPHLEVTHDPGQDHELEAYIAAVRELVPDIDEPKIKHYRVLGYTPEQASKRWRGYCRFLQESKK